MCRQAMDYLKETAAQLSSLQVPISLGSKTKTKKKKQKNNNTNNTHARTTHPHTQNRKLLPFFPHFYLQTCPEEVLLAFHNVPYDHVLRTKGGLTLLQYIYQVRRFAGRGSNATGGSTSRRRRRRMNTNLCHCFHRNDLTLSHVVIEPRMRCSHGSTLLRSVMFPFAHHTVAHKTHTCTIELTRLFVLPFIYLFVFVVVQTRGRRCKQSWIPGHTVQAFRSLSRRPRMQQRFVTHFSSISAKSPAPLPRSPSAAERS